MNTHQRHANRYSNLLVTVQHETNERSVTEIHGTSRKRSRPTYFHSTMIYYNSNHRQKQQFTRSSPSTGQSHLSYRNYQQPIRPLMEIQDNDIAYIPFRQKEPKQRQQYRNRKAELDWDHGFDLDQIHLYTTQNDSDNHSLTSFHSSSDTSFSSG